MTKRSSLFSPTSRQHHHAARRRSLVGGLTSSAMSPSSAQWSRKENTLLVRAWRDVAEHPCAALESVDAFQTRLFLRFQEVSGIGNSNDDDDTVSMAGSECSMESVDGDSAYLQRPARTQTSVVLKTYALRRMAGFIADFIAKQDLKRVQLLEKEEKTGGEEIEMREADSEEQEEEEVNTPVNWFALSKNDQIERFQKVGASNYIELDEHMYTTIETILEIQDKCKQEAAAPVNGVNGGSATNGGTAAAPSQNPWSEEEVRHVLDAWRDSHLRTPTKLPGGDSFYARFIARNGENSQRSKPEVADTKLALMNMQRVVAAFHNRAPTNGKKLTRGNLKRQRQNWFMLNLAEKTRAFTQGGNHHGCRFVDISEGMYETVSDLMGSSTVSMPSSFSPSSSSSSSGGGGESGDVKLEPGKRRSVKTEAGSSDGTHHSIQSDAIDLISDDDSSVEEEGDVDMEEEKYASSTDAAVASSVGSAIPPAGLVSSGGGLDDDVNPDGDADLSVGADNDGLDESMHYGEELKQPAHAQKATDNDAEVQAEVGDLGHDAERGSPRDDDISSSLEATSTESSSEFEASDRTSGDLELISPFKKQKIEDPEVAAMVRGLEQQSQHLADLVRQAREERDQEREERERLLQAIKVDQNGRDTVLELLRIEQDERRHDRDERRKVLQILLHEKQKRGNEKDCGGVTGDDTKIKIKDEL